jgi:hypothetical protein
LFRLSLIPKEKKCFALFEQGPRNPVKIAQQLKDMVSIWENAKERVGVINIWVAHNLERTADRDTNICERVVFTVTGRMEEIGASKY